MHRVVATSDWSLFSSARRSAEPTLPMPINESTEDHIDALPLAPALSLTSKLSVRSLMPKPTIPPPVPKPTIPSLAPVFSTPSNQSYTTSIQPVHPSDQLGEIFNNVGSFGNTNPHDVPQPNLSCSLVTGTTSTPPDQTPLNLILPTRSLRPLHLRCLRRTLPLSILSKCSLQPLQHPPDPK